LGYLPLYLLPDHAGNTAMELVRKAWQEALTAKFRYGKDAPVPDCRRLPGADEPLSERVLALFGRSKPTDAGGGGGARGARPKLPVMVAEWGGEDRVCVRMARPATE
jgi:hypothetical protein